MIVQIARLAVHHQGRLEHPLAAEHAEVVRAQQRRSRVLQSSIEKRNQRRSGVRHGHQGKAHSGNQAVRRGSAVVTLKPAMNSGMGR